MTASVQWMERTLDDSANRRISMPEGFLCADAILRLCQNVTDGLHVNEKVVDGTVREYLPFIATENLMMEAVKRGGNIQHGFAAFHGSSDIKESQFIGLLPFISVSYTHLDVYKRQVQGGSVHGRGT